MSIYKDIWLSDLIGKDVFSIESSSLDELKKINTNIKNSFIFSKLQFERKNDLQWFFNNDFRLIDINVTLEMPIHKIDSNKLYKKYSYEKVSSNNLIRAQSIAKNAFIYDRFHSDPEIDNHIASNIKSEWVKSYLDGNRGDLGIVSTNSDGSLTGFLLIILQNKTCIIDLIAVDSLFRGMGVASYLISLIPTLFQNIGLENVKVGTQLSNINSIALYNKMGFRIVSQNFMLHKHS